MKFIQIYKKVLSEELKTEKVKLKKVQEEIERLRKDIREIEKTIVERASFSPQTPLEVGVKLSFINYLIEEKERLENILRKKLLIEEKLKEKISLTRSREKLLEKLEKKIRIKSEKKKEVELERFVNEVLSYRNIVND